MSIHKSSGKTAIVWSCAHSDPKTKNERFTWLGNLIYDIRPDYVIDLGDFYDMRSLNSYDTSNPKGVVSQNYEKDIEQGLDAQERIRHLFVKNKKKRPTFYGFEGNHEYRIKKAIDRDPRLQGSKYGISFKHLETDRFYDEYTEYKHSAPDIREIDGVLYAHYFSSGGYGRAISGVHHAYTLTQNLNHSATCGHSHKKDIYFKDGSYPIPIIGNVVGCFKGDDEPWAGQSNREWAKGVVIKRNIDQGNYDYQWVSMDSIKAEYSY